jgi:hypothetical protein
MVIAKISKTHKMDKTFKIFKLTNKRKGGEKGRIRMVEIFHVHVENLT